MEKIIKTHFIGVKIIFFSSLIAVGYYFIKYFFDFSFVYLMDNYFGVNYVFIAETLSLLAILLIVIILIAKFVKGSRKQNFNINWILIVLILPFILRIVLDPIYMFPKMVFDINAFEDTLAFPTKTDWMYHLNYLFLTALLTPIIEELVFRKGIITLLLKSKFKLKGTIIISSVLFAIIHINPYQIPGSLLSVAATFIMGVFFAYIYIKTKSIIYPIILHIGINFIWYLRRLNNLEYLKIIEILDFGILYWGVVLICISLSYFFMIKYYGNESE